MREKKTRREKTKKGKKGFYKTALKTDGQKMGKSKLLNHMITVTEFIDMAKKPLITCHNVRM